MRTFIHAGGLFLFSMALPVLADPPYLEDQAKAVDPWINSVITCGNWEYKGVRGSFRIVSGYISGHTAVYIQWVSDPHQRPNDAKEEDPEPHTLVTASVNNLDDYEAESEIQNLECVEHSSHWFVEGDVDNGDGSANDQKYRLSIELKDEPGKYIEKELPAKSKRH